MSEIYPSTESAKRIMENRPREMEVGFEVAGKRLEGMVVEAGNESSFDMLLLGGGGNIPHREYYGAWQYDLAGIGISSMSFDFRGVGADKDALYETGLETRLEDAKVAADYLKRQHPDRKLIIMGLSMGGPIAIRLANEVKADGLVLAAPAAYSEEARHKLFGPEFKAALNKNRSWEGSPDFSELEQFEGKVLLAYGEQDDIIDEPILERYDKIAREKGTVLVIPEVGHRFMRLDDPESVAARHEVRANLEMLVAYNE